MTLDDLQKAIFSGCLDSIEEILEEDVDDLLSQRDKRTGSSAIHYATFVGRIDIIRYLIHQGAEVDARNNRGETPLHIACTRNLAEVVHYFMRLDIDKFPLTQDNWSVLHCCAASNSVECAELLHFTAYEINSRNFFGETPLHVACASNNRYMVDWLLKRQADPEICDNLSRQPMHLACSVGSIDIVHLLHARKAPLNTTDYKERTIFHYACRSPTKQQYTIDMLQYLLDNTNVSPWSTDLDDAYPIHYALKCRKTKVAKFLAGLTTGRTNFAVFKVFCYASAMDASSSFFNTLRKGVSSEIRFMTDRFGFTPLHYAAEYDREDRVTCLLSMRIDVNSRAKDGTTPLHCAVAAKSRYGAEVLLENKADVNAARADGITPLHLACIFPNQDILVELLDANADIFATDNDGRTPLMFLCNAEIETDEVLQMLEVLLAHRPSGPDLPNQLELTDRHGRTALHYACAKGNPSVVVELVKCGANVTSVDNRGKNALHLAVHSRQPFKIMNTLTLKTKTIVTVRDRRGFLPVHYAAMKKNADVVVDLLKLGRAKSNFLPQSGIPHQLTPLHLAARYGQTAVVEAITNFIQNPNQLEDCLRGFEALKLTEDDAISPNTSFEQDTRRPYDPLTAYDNLRRIPLHYAMAYGNESMLKTLVPADKSSTLGWKDCDGVTPLMMAASNGNTSCVQFALELLENASNARVVRQSVDDQKRCAAMFSVTAKGDSYKLLVTADIVTKKDRQLRGFIHRAAFAKKNDLLANIISWAPSEIDAEDSKKVTALHMACASGNVRGVELLLEANANLKKLDINRLSPSDWAAASGQSAVLALLLTKYKERVLLSEFAIAKACENGSLKCVQLLVQHFPDMVQCLAGYQTPLHLACEIGNWPICRLLVENGALMDVEDSEGYTPLMLAAKCLQGEECVAILTAEEDCPLICKGPDGNSALHLACLHNNLNSAMYIYNALTRRDELSIVLAQSNHKRENLLHLSIKMTSSTMLKEFTRDMKSSLADKDNRGRMPFYSMIEQPEVIENMRFLLEELIELSREGETPNISNSTGNRSHIDDASSSQGDLDESY